MIIFDKIDPLTRIRARAARARPLPCPPVTSWKPGRFVSLRDAKMISIDCETFDPLMRENGPGWARGASHIVGVSIGTDDGFRAYYPVRHTVEGELNLNPDHVFAWLRDELKGSHPKVGANIFYDVGNLSTENVVIGGAWYDVQFAEALLQEEGSTALEALGQKYCGEGKTSNALYEWSAKAYGGQPGGDQRANIYRCPVSLVGPYAESDVDLPLRVLEKQLPLLRAQNLMNVFELECGLQPLLFHMQKLGVRVDLTRAEELRATLIEGQARLQTRLNDIAGCSVEVNTSESLARAFDRAGIEYPRTEKDNPSFVKKWLEAHPSDLAQMILAVRRTYKLRSTFIESYILNAHVNGRVHGQFHLLRRDSEDSEGGRGGTRSGRLSSSVPNLQNIPSRKEDERSGYVKALRDVGIGNLAPMLRALFCRERDHKAWRKFDYAGIEYRMLVHFAIGPGSDEARRAFNLDPDTDFHSRALDIVGPIMGWDVATPEGRKQWRPLVKNFGFGMLYAMGKDALAELLHLSPEQTEILTNAYHAGIPYAKTTANHFSRHAERYGEITTVLGRKSRFEKWEPAAWTPNARALSRHEAIREYGMDIRRAHTHKALNRVLQGSAADLMKAAMLRAYREGLFDYIGFPRLTVHDELDFSDPGGVDDGFEELRHIMETAIPLRLPVKAECEIGPDWGHTKAA